MKSGLLVACLFVVQAGGKSNLEFLEEIETTRPFYPPLKNTEDKHSWEDLGTVAAGIGLSSPPSTLSVPLEVAIFTVGLDGSGRAGVDIPDSQLQHWLSHLDETVLQHVLEMQQHAPPKGGEEAESAYTLLKEGPAIEYRLKYKLVKLAPEVTAVVEAVLKASFRVVKKNDDADDADVDDADKPLLQVDGRVMSGLLEGLLVELGVQSTYSIFVLNPNTKWMNAHNPGSDGVRYGYRDGLSDAEIKAVLEDPTTSRASIFDMKHMGKLMKHTDLDQEPAPIAWQQVKGKVTPHDLTAPSKAWADKRLQQMQGRPGMQWGPLSPAAALQSLKGTHSEGGFQEAPQYRHGEHRVFFQKPKVVSIPLSNVVPKESCLVDNWVGRGRLAFLDLAAGPFHWGPISTGEGVRTTSSFPNVDTFQILQESDSAGGDDAAETETMYDWESIEAEKMLLEDAIKLRCPPGHAKSKECEETRAKLSRIKNFVQATQPQTKQATSDFQHANAFSFVSHEQGHSGSLIESQFLAQLSATLSSYVRSNLAPAVLAPPAPLHSGYAAQVNFPIFVLRDHQSYDPLAEGLLERLKAALTQLKLPSQEFTFSVQTLTMDDDPELAVAFTSALRTAVVPTIRYDGQFLASKRLYLDSKALEDELRSLDSDAADADGGSRDIPIFIFSLDKDLPVFVDQHYQSQALSSMVVAVQSAQQEWETPVSCNSRPIYRNLRDPVRSIVQDASRVLTGLLPSHVTYSTAYDRVTQDWTWSVGDHPCSITSNGLGYARTQLDVAHRAYITNAVRVALARMQGGLHTLQRLPATTGNEGLTSLSRFPLEQRRRRSLEPVWRLIRLDGSESDATVLKQQQHEIMVQISSLLQCASDKTFDACVGRLPDLKEHVELFISLVEVFTTEAEAYECEVRHGVVQPHLAASWLPYGRVRWYLSLGCLGMLAALRRMVWGGPPKAKFN